VCGKGDWCLVARDGSQALCMRRESARSAPAGGWLHLLAPGRIAPQPDVVASPVGSPRRVAPLEILDQVYEALLGQLSLSAHHAAQLLARGMDDAEIAAGGYRTFTRHRRADIARHLADQFTPGALTRVPGFYIDDNGQSAYLTLAGPAGLLIPCRDADGHLTGLQIRRDQAGPRYLPLTSYTESKPRRGGTPVTVSLLRHVAYPPRITDPRVFITEGTIKAHMAAWRLGAVVVSSPGVACWNAAGIVETAVKLAKPGGSVVVAYDADRAKKSAVAQAEAALCRALEAAGLCVHVARWDAHVGKGLDDLLVAGGTFGLEEPEDWETSSRLPSRVIEVDLPPPQASSGLFEGLTYTVEEVRQHIYTTAVRLLEEGVPGLHLFTSPPGSGKTTCILQALADLARAGHLVDWRDRAPIHRRVLFLTDTKEALAELVSAVPGLREIAAFREGRSDDPASPWYCARKAEVDELAHARHNAARELCWTCHERLPHCPYMRSKQQAERQNILLAPKAVALSDPSFLDGPADLSPFSAVVVDESLTPALLEDVRITRREVNALEEGLERCGAGEGDPFRTFLDLLRHVLEGGERPQARPCWLPLPGLLRETARSRDIDLAGLLERLASAIQREDASGGAGLLPFEESFYSQGRRVVPLRFMRDLVARLREDHERPEGADVSSWLEFAHQGTGSRIHLALKQRALHRALSSMLVLNTDACPDVHSLRFAFPHFEVHDWPVDQHVHVTQFSNSSYSKSVLMAHRSCRDDVERLVGFYRLVEDRVLVITHKSLLPEETICGSDDDAFVGWWGKHHRALNRFSDIDALVVASYFCENLGVLRARVQVLRDSLEPRAESGTMPGPDPERSSEYRIYEGYRDEQGRGRARLIPLDADPDVQAAIDASWSGAVHQAIGRGRPLLRDPENPLRVFLLPAVPVEGLNVDDLQSTAAILGKGHPVTDLNRGKQDEAAERVAEAIGILVSEGKQPTINAIYTRFGGRWSTIRRELERWKREQGMA